MRSDCPLTPRQIEIIGWLSKGKTAGDVAEIVGLKKFTVQKQIAHSFDRTGTPNATALVATALREGWIE